MAKYRTGYYLEDKNLPDVPLVDVGHQYETHGVVLDASRPGHTHLRKYYPHPHLPIYIPDLDPTNNIAIYSQKQHENLRFVEKYVFKYPP